jgi:hypothetical protein
VTRHMELGNPELKYSVFFFRPQILNSKIELGKSLAFTLTKLRTELSRNDDSLRVSGENYFS